MEEEILLGAPLPAFFARQAAALAARCGLRPLEPAEITFTALLLQDSQAAAAASLCGQVVKGIAVDPARRGEGLLERLMAALLAEAARRGQTHLFLYTKPGNAAAFGSCGFAPVAETPDVLLMENSRTALDQFLAALAPPQAARPGPVGAIVANADPFTKGHLYLAEQAAARCGALHLFILAEDRGAFPAGARLEMARAAVVHLPNVAVHSGGPYLISAATFPDYFLKSRADAARCAADLDLALFAQRVAPALGITRRFVGTEPFCPVTAAYNRAMRRGFAGSSVQLIELPRLEQGGVPVSASKVRALLAAGRPQQAAALVPPATIPYFTLYRKEDVVCPAL